MTTNTQLPQELKDNLKKLVKKRSISSDYATGYEEGYRAGSGATSYAEKLIVAEQNKEDYRKECERLAGIIEKLQAQVRELTPPPPVAPGRIDNNPIA